MFSYPMQQQQTISWLDCDMKLKVAFIWWPAMTSSVVWWRGSSKALPKAKLAEKQGHGHYLVVCYTSNSVQLSESWWNHYIWEIYSENQWNAPKTTPITSTGQQKGPNFFPQWPDHMSHNQSFKSWMNWATKFCPIHHIHLTSHQPTTTSSSISTTFCREKASTTSRRQKMLSESLSNPEVQNFMLEEKTNLFLVGKIVLILMVPCRGPAPADPGYLKERRLGEGQGITA